MIENTFQIMPSVGPGKERGFWDGGILTWRDFIDAGCVRGVSAASKERFDSVLEDAYRRLEARDSLSLGAMMPRREHWRLYGEFGRDAAFLDIETDGLERDSLVTVVTVVRNGDATTLVEGRDLDAEALAEALDGASMLVTFNGSCFDVPVLRCSFPMLDLDLPHFDLRFGCRKVGYTGGLKNIERILGLSRSGGIGDIDGMDAVLLWDRWTRKGDERSLELLVEYNRADTVNLRAVADIAYGRLVREYAGFVH